MSLAAADFGYLADLIHRRSAIVLESGKEYLAESRLESVARANGLKTEGELVAGMRNGTVNVQDDVINAMTTNETTVYRDIHPFKALPDPVLTEPIERQQAAPTLTIWGPTAQPPRRPATITTRTPDTRTK